MAEGFGEGGGDHGFVVVLLVNVGDVSIVEVDCVTKYERC